MIRRVLCVRLDSAGDVLLTGPAVRAVAESGAEVTMLTGLRGIEAAELLPGISEVLCWQCPWIAAEPPAVDAADVDFLVRDLRERQFDAALIFTSFHQSALPTALLLRLAGISWVGGISEDYPGSLLDLRHRVDDDIPEAERALSLVEAAGFELPVGDDRSLSVRTPLPNVRHLTGSGPFVVLHPGTSAPARAWPTRRFTETAALLAASGRRVVVTGADHERPLTMEVAGDVAVDLGGRTSLRELAAVMERAEVVVAGNTGPAHLAAAVGTPVVSLFAPTVPAVRWAPYRVPCLLLGDQEAACAGTRAVSCPVPGHPCLTSVRSWEVIAAIELLTDRETPGAVASAVGALKGDVQ